MKTDDTASVDAPPLDKAAQTAKPREKKRKKKRRHFNRALFFILLIGVVLATPVVFLASTGATFVAPVWLSDRLELEVNDRFEGGRLDLGTIEVTVDKRFRPTVLMRFVGVFDQGGTEVAQLNQVSATLSMSELLRRNVSMQSLEVSGAQVTIRRSPDGTFALSFGNSAKTTGNLADVLDSVEQAFAKAPLSELDEVRANELTLTLEDARSGRLWQVTGGAIVLRNTQDFLDLTISADVFNGTEELATTIISLTSEKGSKQATLNAFFQNATAADIAAQSPALAFLSVLDAPISGALRTQIGEDGLLQNLSGTLDIAQGALRPTVDTPPIAFESAVISVDFDPEANQMTFDSIAFESEGVSFTGEGTAWLQDLRNGWPESLVGQFRVADMRVEAKELFAKPMTFDRGAFDFRMKLNPFSVDIGQVSLGPAEQRFLASGRVRTDDDGWGVALDLDLNEMPLDRILEIWPFGVANGARVWVASNVYEGRITDLSGAMRFATDEPVKASVSFRFDEALVKAVQFLPTVRDGAGYVSMTENTFTMVAESGHITAPQGGDVDISGSVFHIPNMGAAVESAEVTLLTQSPMIATLSLLNLPPLSLLDKGDLPIDIANGFAQGRAILGFDLVDGLSVEDVVYTVTGSLSNVRSTKLIEDKTFTARTVSFRADENSVEMSGRAAVNGLPVTGSWVQKFGADAAGTSRVEGTIEISQKFLDVFNIELPANSMSGAGVGQIVLDMAKGQAPRFSLTSDLNRIGVSLAAINWSKPKNRTGNLEIKGRLGDVPSIDRLSLRAPGLNVSGTIDLTPSGALAKAQFDRVQVGGWLDGPVTLTGRGGNRPLAIAINGGRVDMRTAEVGAGGGEEGGPLTMRLDRLTVSEGITLTNFRGDFKEGRGLDGQFSANVNGGPAIRGSVLPTPTGTAIRILGDKSGSILAAAGVIRNTRGGTLDLTLTPTRQPGTYNGRLKIKNTKLIEAPSMTELISAISIIGLVDQLNNNGITMSDIEAEFKLGPEILTLYRSSAVGPSIGVSLDGLYNLRTDRMDMQGVISPVYFLNGIGQIFSRGREGLFGFSFRLTGVSENPKVRVNPLSILTPGAFRDIFRRPPPKQTR